MSMLSDKVLELDETEMTEVLEIARLAMDNVGFFDSLVEQTDLPDGYLMNLRQKIEKMLS